MTALQQSSTSGYSFHDGPPHYKMFEVDSRLRYFKPHTSSVEKTFADEISDSLGRKRNSRFISPKFFYDDAGSELFEKICSTPEYYPTRTETAILEDVGGELGSILHGSSSGSGAWTPGDRGVRLVELGSGSSVKTRIILDVLFGVQEDVEYFPIDISDILAQSSEQLLADYPGLRITGIIDTYDGGLEFLQSYDRGRNLVIFLGSSYGNMSPADGTNFLQRVRSSMKPGDMFLIGLDMVKDERVLESAYNDCAGVTSRFNLNVLSRINSELGANFDLGNFEHRATYNTDKQRIEMYLESVCEQTVVISKSGLELQLERGELIHTENSYKYGRSQAADLLASAGFCHERTWTDPDEYFALLLASVPEPDGRA